ncbi:hypothetical protein ACJBUE_12675 [Ralstonia syzygii subsp. celebesensis]|uniref:hypothetical protein n=1 Tax=Ralstonia syzygii TaxID=28097 RepID=UPI00387E04B1
MNTPITPQFIAGQLSRFAVLVPLHDTARLGGGPLLVQVWCEALESEDAETVERACRNLYRKLKRFPVPADVLEEIREMRGPEVQQ